MTIYAIGTSHTYGECQDRENNKIQKPWPALLSERLGTEVINYGRRGVNNQQLIEMTEHVCQNEKPEMIIAEMRWHPLPLLIENHENLEKSEEFSENLFSFTRHSDQGYDKYRHQYHAIWRNSFSVEEYPWSKKCPKKLVDDIQGYMNINFNHNVFHNQSVMQAASSMYHVAGLCRAYGVPVKVFVWGGFSFGDSDKNRPDLSGLDTFDFFKQGRTFILYAEDKHSNDWIQKNQCKCGHMNEVLHEYFVDTVIDEVKQSLTS